MILQESLQKALLFTQSEKRFLVFAALCLIAFVITLTPLAQSLSQAFNQDDLVQSNLSYLDYNEKELRQTVLTLGALKAVFYTLQSSEVGISFFVDANITLGHALAPITDMLDSSIEIIVASTVSVFFLKVVADLAETVAPALFILTLIIATVFFALRYFASSYPLAFSAMRPIAASVKITAGAFILAYFIVPYTIHAAAYLNTAYTQELRAELNQGLKHLHDSEVKTAQDNLSDSAKHHIKHYKKIVAKSPHILDMLARYYTHHLVLWIIEFVALPLAVLFLLGRIFYRLGTRITKH